MAKMIDAQRLTERKPCPFCGGDAELIHDDSMTYGFYTPNWGVRCIMEDCIGYDIDPKYAQMEDAIAAWNNRVQEVPND